jgi:RNA polymerase sigma factor (sigma-70 family)
MRKRATSSAVVASTLDRIWSEGRRAHGSLGLDLQALREVLEGRIAARLDDLLGLSDDATEAAALLGRVDATGLFLAAACEVGRDGAWEELTRIYTPRLVGLAIRRGLPPSEAAGLADDVLGALALPPPRGGSRTRFGTYLGAGTLFGWLATMLVRRIADRARGRRTASLDADPEVASTVSADSGAQPLPAAVARETAEKVADALSRAWTRLSPRERLVLALKYRDGRTQRAVARVLGVGEPRVSRLVRQALDKVQEPIRAAIGEIEDEQWPALGDAVRTRLATLAADLRPPPAGTTATGGPDES